MKVPLRTHHRYGEQELIGCRLMQRRLNLGMCSRVHTGRSGSRQARLLRGLPQENGRKRAALGVGAVSTKRSADVQLAGCTVNQACPASALAAAPGLFFGLFHP